MPHNAESDSKRRPHKSHLQVSDVGPDLPVALGHCVAHQLLKYGALGLELRRVEGAAGIVDGSLGYAPANVMTPLRRTAKWKTLTNTHNAAKPKYPASLRVNVPTVGGTYYIVTSQIEE